MQHPDHIPDFSDEKEEAKHREKHLEIFEQELIADPTSAVSVQDFFLKALKSNLMWVTFDKEGKRIIDGHIILIVDYYCIYFDQEEEDALEVAEFYTDTFAGLGLTYREIRKNLNNIHNRNVDTDERKSI